MYHFKLNKYSWESKFWDRVILGRNLEGEISEDQF